MPSSESTNRIDAWRRVRQALRYARGGKDRPRPADPEVVERFLRRVSRHLAGRYPVNAERLLKILRATVEPGLESYYAAARIGSIEDNLWLCFFPSLVEVLYHLPTEEAVGIFESSEVGRLAEYEALVIYLRTSDAPLYGLPELADLLRSFAEYLLLQREHLVTTGYPVYYFPRSAWLASRLDTLYFTKQPIRCGRVRDGNGRPGRAFTWSKVAESEGQSAEQACSYEEADYLPELTAGDGERLEQIRPKLFDLKLDIVEELASSVSRRGPARLWEKCLSLLTECLLNDEPEFLLRIDHLYTGFDIRRPDTSEQGLGYDPGGLSNLLELIGHCEEELTIGAFAKTRRALGNDLVSRLRSSEGPGLDYFRACSVLPREQLDSLLDGFLALESQAQEFWKGYITRVNEALGNEFYEEVEIREKVKRHLAHKFEPHLRRFSDVSKAYLESYGEPPEVRLTHTVLGSQEGRNMFRREGQTWSVVYDSKHITLDHSDGATYIAYLLEHPDTHLRVHDLYAIAHPNRPASGVKPYTDVSSEELADIGLSPDNQRSPTDRQDDAELFSTYRKAQTDLQKELDEAHGKGDSRKVDELQTQLENVNRLISARFRPDGRPRLPGDRNKRAYDRVSKAIEPVKRFIKQHHSSLARHLDNSLHYDTYVYHYSPEPPITWET